MSKICFFKWLINRKTLVRLVKKTNENSQALKMKRGPNDRN